MTTAYYNICMIAQIKIERESTLIERHMRQGTGVHVPIRIRGI